MKIFNINPPVPTITPTERQKMTECTKIFGRLKHLVFQKKKKKKIITPDKKLGVTSVAELTATTPANSPNYYTRIQPLAI